MGKNRLTVYRIMEPMLIRIGIHPRKFTEFIKFAIVGGSGIIVNMGLFFFLTRFIDIRIEFASPVAIEISILSNFLLNNIWTFRKRETTVPFFSRMVRYHLVTGLAGIVNYLTVNIKGTSWTITREIKDCVC